MLNFYLQTEDLTIDWITLRKRTSFKRFSTQIRRLITRAFICSLKSVKFVIKILGGMWGDFSQRWVNYIVIS